MFAFTSSLFKNPRPIKGTTEYDTSGLLDITDHGLELNNLLSTNKSLYEWVKCTDTVQPYFDIDYHVPDGTNDEMFKELVDSTLDEAVCVLCERFPDLSNDDLRVSHYNGKCDDGTIKVSYHVLIHGHKITVKQNHAIAKELHEICPTFDTAVYRKAGLFRVGGHHKATHPKVGTRTPKLMYYHDDEWKDVQNAMQEVNGTPIADFRCQHLIKNVDSNAQMIVDTEDVALTTDAPAPTHIVKEAVQEAEPSFSVNDSILTHLKQLPSTYTDNRNKWWYVTTLLKALGEKATWDAWSKTSDKYDKTGNNKEWNGINNTYDETEAAARLNKLFTTQGDLISRLHTACQDGSTEDMCDLFIDLWKNYWKVVKYPKEIWMYDMNDCLWKEVPQERFNTFVSKHLGPLRKSYIRLLGEHPERFVKTVDEEGKVLEVKAINKLVAKCVKNVCANKMTTVKNSFRIEFFNREEIQDPLFNQSLNSNPDVLSTLNGIVDLHTGAFRKRKYDDFISKCLAIDYDATQTNVKFEKFMLDIFDHPTLDADDLRQYMQVFLGYGMTGHNSAHKCCILYGDGSNGKSVLNDCLFKVMRCKYGTMINSWDSKFFDDKASANENVNSPTPELAKLVGCNIGIINETSKDLVLGERYKKWNDTCEAFSYCQKYGTPKEAKLITTFMMSTNYWPNFPIKECYIRRTEPIPMLVSFVSNPTQPDQKMKDEGLFQAMTATPELMAGMLNWFVRGAIRWYDNNQLLLDYPECTAKVKQKYINRNDWRLLFTVGMTTEEEDKCSIDDTMWISDIISLIDGSSDAKLKLSQKEIKDDLVALGATATRVNNPQTKRKELLFKFVKEADDDDE